jgi:thioredoxin 1
MPLNHKRNRMVVVFLVVIFAGICAFTFAHAQSVTEAPPRAKQLPRLIDLGRKQCIPCKMMASVLDQLERDYAGILDVEFIDVGENPDAADKYNIRGIPTQIFYDASGKELFRHLGYISKEQILHIFKRMGVDLKASARQQKT